MYRNNWADAGKVMVTKLVSWIPRMVFNLDGINFTFLNLFGLLECLVMWLFSMPVIKV